ncbi:hypothetical protein TRFO_07528 [Tritrichomonas foetus]|uniref:Uncharacterized protein n=1 Tax=Tritrichomonas foetus TaxID=1144522 RepID=A0A1J4JR09_9EUKA|nr:hypothetical protein TRFO_07528 [Tritrichomonas foetus]|eukprot:OHT01615.1 hypothetical protein TRFO_07528 [Tritrichomonas foetus]
MIPRKPRKPSLNRTTDSITTYTRRNLVSTTHALRSPRSEKNSYKLNSLSKKPNRIGIKIREIDQMMKSLFILDDDVSSFSSILKSALISGSNTNHTNSTGDTFFKFWNSYVQSITSYLQQPTSLRLLKYISFKFDISKNILHSIFLKNESNFHFDQRQKNRIEKMGSEVNSDFSKMQSMIDLLKENDINIDNTNKNSNKANNNSKNNNQNAENFENRDDEVNETENARIAKISDLTYYFDCFFHDISSKYSFFFECMIPEKTMRDPILKELYKVIKSIVDCCLAASKVDDMKNKFIQSMNDASDTFCQLFKRKTKNINNLASTETRVHHKHRNSSFFSKPTSPARPIHRNKTDVYLQLANEKRRRNSIRSKKELAVDDSSSGKDKLIPMAVPSESIEESTKILPKTHRQTISKSKLDHLNHKFIPDSPNQKHKHHPQNGDIPNSNINPINTLNTRKDPKRPRNFTSKLNSYHSPSQISRKQQQQNNHSLQNQNHQNSQHHTTQNISSQQNNRLQNNHLLNIQPPSQDNLNQQQNNHLQILKEERKQDIKNIISPSDSFSQQSDTLKQKKQQLIDQLNHHPLLEQLNSLTHEVDYLKTLLSQTPAGYDDVSNEMKMKRDLVNIIKESIELYSDEIEPSNQIKNGLLSSIDDTVAFDNLRLKKLCENLNEKIQKRLMQLNELKNEKNRFLFANEISTSYESQLLSNEDKIAAFSFINYDTNLIKCENSRLETQLSRLQNNPFCPVTLNDYNTINFNSAFNQSQIQNNILSTDSVNNDSNNSLNNNLENNCNSSGSSVSNSSLIIIGAEKDNKNSVKKLQHRINKLIDSINSIRKTRSSDIFSMITDELFKINTAQTEVKRLDQELSTKIDKYITANEGLQMKRKIFDKYEQLKEKSRELQIEYFSLQKNITKEMSTSEKYQIELQMDDIQDQYTTVMMDIERLGKIDQQESLHDFRKERIRGRREMAKFIEQEFQVASDSLEAEKRVTELEKEVKALTTKIFPNTTSNINSNNNTSNHLFNNSLANKGVVNICDRLVNKIAEELTEVAQTEEILNIINEQTKQFNLEIDDQSNQTNERQKIEDLKETVEKMLINGGMKMKQKIRIYNLRKEIEAFHV